MLPDVAESIRPPEEETSRRGLLTMLGVGGAAALAALATSKEAKAGHDGTNVLHIAATNFDPDTGVGGTAAQGTQLQADTDDYALLVENNNSGANAGGITGVAGSGSVAGVRGVQFKQGPAVEGDASSGDANGVGVQGRSDTGVGVNGQCDNGIGGSFFSENGTALIVGGTANVNGNNGSREILMVSQEAAGEGALQATALHGGIGIEGAAEPTEETLPFPDQQNGYGVRGVSNLSNDSEGYGQGPGVGVHGESGTGIGVLGTIRGTGVAMQAASWAEEGISFDGVALSVHGRARFSGSGSGVVSAGQSSASVADPHVAAQSHVSVTLTSNPGSRSVHWVELDPGTGFTVHMTPASFNKRPETNFTYLVTEY